jgi:hypothetical protein
MDTEKVGDDTPPLTLEALKEAMHEIENWHYPLSQESALWQLHDELSYYKSMYERGLGLTPLKRELHPMPDPGTTMHIPLSSSGGKRGIAGTIIGLMLDEHAKIPYSVTREKLPLFKMTSSGASGIEPLPKKMYLRRVYSDFTNEDIPDIVTQHKELPPRLRSKCDVCDEMFTTAGELRIHRQDKHGWVRGRQPPETPCSHQSSLQTSSPDDSTTIYTPVILSQEKT